MVMRNATTPIALSLSLSLSVSVSVCLSVCLSVWPDGGVISYYVSRACISLLFVIFHLDRKE